MGERYTNPGTKAGDIAVLYASAAIVERLRAAWPPRPANPLLPREVRLQLLHYEPCIAAEELGLTGTGHAALQLPTAPDPRLPGDLYTVTGGPRSPLWLPGNRLLQGARATRLHRTWHNPAGYYTGQFGPLYVHAIVPGMTYGHGVFLQHDYEMPAPVLRDTVAAGALQGGFAEPAAYLNHRHELPHAIAPEPYRARALRELTFEDYVRETQGTWNAAWPAAMNYTNDAAPRWDAAEAEGRERQQAEETGLLDMGGPIEPRQPPYLGNADPMIVETETAELTPNAFAGLRRLLGGPGHGQVGVMITTDGNALARPAYGHTWDTLTDDAEDRGWQLLDDYLGSDQYDILKETGSIVVVGSRGTSYRIHLLATFNVTELDDDGQPVTRLCVVPTEAVPKGDRLLAQLLLLQADEPGYWRRANVQPHDAYSGADSYDVLQVPPWERPAARARQERLAAKLRIRQEAAAQAIAQGAAAQDHFNEAMRRAAAATQVEIEELGRAMGAIMAHYQPTVGPRVAARMARTEMAARAHGAGPGDALLLTLQRPEVADAYGLPIEGAPLSALFILQQDFHMTQRDALRYLLLVGARAGELPERHAYRAFSRYQCDLCMEDGRTGRQWVTRVAPATPRPQTAQPHRPRAP